MVRFTCPFTPLSSSSRRRKKKSSNSSTYPKNNNPIECSAQKRLSETIDASRDNESCIPAKNKHEILLLKPQTSTSDKCLFFCMRAAKKAGWAWLHCCSLYCQSKGDNAHTHSSQIFLNLFSTEYRNILFILPANPLCAQITWDENCLSISDNCSFLPILCVSITFFELKILMPLEFFLQQQHKQHYSFWKISQF